MLHRVGLLGVLRKWTDMHGAKRRSNTWKMNESESRNFSIQSIQSEPRPSSQQGESSLIGLPSNGFNSSTRTPTLNNLVAPLGQIFLSIGVQSESFPLVTTIQSNAKYAYSAEISSIAPLSSGSKRH